jgi:hypothetical protein
LDVEGDVIDRADIPRENFDEVPDFEQWHDAMLPVTSAELRVSREKGLSGCDQRHCCQGR